MAERYVRNVEVGGSSPLTSTKGVGQSPSMARRVPSLGDETPDEAAARRERGPPVRLGGLEATAHQRRSGWRSLPATYVIVHRLRWKRPDPSDESATDLWAEATSRLATAADVCGVNPKGASVEVQAVHDTLARM